MVLPHKIAIVLRPQICDIISPCIYLKVTFVVYLLKRWQLLIIFVVIYVNMILSVIFCCLSALWWECSQHCLPLIPVEQIIVCLYQLLNNYKFFHVFAWDSEHALGCASTRAGCRSVCTVWLNRGPTNLGAAHSENNFYLREGGYVFVVCLLATLCENFQTKRICMKFLGKVGNGPMNKWLNFGGDHSQGLFSGFITIGRKWYQPTALRDVAVHGMR